MSTTPTFPSLSRALETARNRRPGYCCNTCGELYTDREADVRDYVCCALDLRVQCLLCNESDAVCDDYCVACQTRVMLDEGDTDFSGKYWDEPHWRDVRAAVLGKVAA